MADRPSLLIGATAEGAAQTLDLGRANRHGLIAGATGTGKTVTLQTLAEGFSRAGVPVFMADVKGDLAGMAMPGSPLAKSHAILSARAAEIGVEGWSYEPSPAILWDLYGESGHPIRTTVSEMGPLLLARLLGLNEVQEGVLAIAFHLADEEGLLLLDLDDLQAMLAEVAARAPELSAKYGNVSKPSVGAIQRSLLQLRSQGGNRFFGEPALDVADLLRLDDDGRGVVSILAADRLMAAPKLYSTFLLWLLSELFEALPEIGDPDRPKLVFFFDEAHLLFEEAPPALLDKVEQVVRLIRSKGVGVWFVTQNPMDIPESVAGQLGNRVQHALRAFTARDQKAIRAVAESFPVASGLDLAEAITELKVGEALVSTLQPDGAPSPAARTLIAPPRSRLGPLADAERAAIRASSSVGERYDEQIDRHSAEEMLAERAAAKVEEAPAAAPARQPRQRAPERTLADRMIESAARSAASSVGRQLAGSLGSRLLRGLLGGLTRGR